MEWMYLIIAGLFEMFAVVMINKLHHDRKVSSFFLLVGGFGLSFLFLALAMETLPMSTAYAVWTGIGAAGGAILGMIFYKESKDWMRIFFISLVIGATIGLKLFS
ncbi:MULTISPECIES: DMT family transporter [Bacillus]|uniref:DMT family transporter n=1 Tax=Bacillus TaxID=1386 RepID=UPI000BB6A362|nr:MULTISPECIES: multidrug efflux SMR transporter [Bacillus]